MNKNSFLLSKIKGDNVVNIDDINSNFDIIDITLENIRNKEIQCEKDIDKLNLDVSVYKNQTDKTIESFTNDINNKIKDLKQQTATTTPTYTPSYGSGSYYDSTASSNEQKRVISERERIIKEQDRVNSEKERVLNEQSRINSERERISNEQNRITQFENLKKEIQNSNKAQQDKIKEITDLNNQFKQDELKIKEIQGQVEKKESERELKWNRIEWEYQRNQSEQQQKIEEITKMTANIKVDEQKRVVAEQQRENEWNELKDKIKSSTSSTSSSLPYTPSWGYGTSTQQNNCTKYIDINRNITFLQKDIETLKSNEDKNKQDIDVLKSDLKNIKNSNPSTMSSEGNISNTSVEELQKAIDSKADGDIYRNDGIFAKELFSINVDERNRNLFIFNTKGGKYLTLNSNGVIAYDQKALAFAKNVPSIDNYNFREINIDGVSIARNQFNRSVNIFNKKASKCLALGDDGYLSYDNNPIPVSGKPAFEATIKISRFDGVKRIPHRLGRVPIFTVSTTVGNVTPTVEVDNLDINCCNYNSDNDCTITVRCY